MSSSDMFYSMILVIMCLQVIGTNMLGFGAAATCVGLFLAE